MDSRLTLLLLAVAVVGQFPVNDTGVPLPPGCKQVLWYRGTGNQDYICSDPTNMGMLMWTLVEPHAVLQQYSGNLVATPINGYHFFSNPGIDGQAGSGPGWRLGSGCSYYSCPTTTDEFLGAVNTSAPQPGTIPWLLISRVSSYGPDFGPIQYVQRLSTVGGVPPISCSYLGQTYNAAYQADYLFATCTSTPQATQTTPPFNPNNPHQKYTSNFHSTSTPTPTSSPTPTSTPTPTQTQTTPPFNPNNPHGKYTKPMYTSTPTPTPTPTQTQTTPPFNPNNPHGRYTKPTHSPYQTTLPPITPSPTETPNVATYESYTKYRQVYHPTHNTRPVNVVPPTPQPEPEEEEETPQQQPHRHIPQPTHSQTFSYFQKSRELNKENPHHSLPSHSQSFNYFKKSRSATPQTQQEQEQEQQSLNNEAPFTYQDPTPTPREINYNPHEQHQYQPRTRHYNQQWTQDPTPTPREINYNPHEQHQYRPRTRHYDQVIEDVHVVDDNGLPLNPRVDTPEVNQPPPTELRGPRGRIGSALKQKLNINPTPTPEEVNYNPHESHGSVPRTRHY